MASFAGAGAQILLKDVGVAPLPNYKRDVKKGIARWDAFVNVANPDAPAAELASRDVEFSERLKDTYDGLRGFELKDADGYVLFFVLGDECRTNVRINIACWNHARQVVEPERGGVNKMMNDEC